MCRFSLEYGLDLSHSTLCDRDDICDIFQEMTKSLDEIRDVYPEWEHERKMTIWLLRMFADDLDSAQHSNNSWVLAGSATGLVATGLGAVLAAPAVVPLAVASAVGATMSAVSGVHHMCADNNIRFRAGECVKRDESATRSLSNKLGDLDKHVGRLAKWLDRTQENTINFATVHDVARTVTPIMAATASTCGFYLIGKNAASQAAMAVGESAATVVENAASQRAKAVGGSDAKVVENAVSKAAKAVGGSAAKNAKKTGLKINQAKAVLAVSVVVDIALIAFTVADLLNGSKTKTGALFRDYAQRLENEFNVMKKIFENIKRVGKLQEDAKNAHKDAELAHKNKELELARKDAELAHKNKELAHKDAELARKDAEIANRDAEIARKDAEMARKEAENAKLKQDTRLKDGKIVELEEKIDNLREEIVVLRQLVISVIHQKSN